VKETIKPNTVRTRIIGPCPRTLELPLLVWSDVFFFVLLSWGQIFGVFFTPLPEEEIFDCIAHGPIIQVLTVPDTSHPMARNINKIRKEVSFA